MTSWPVPSPSRITSKLSVICRLRRPHACDPALGKFHRNLTEISHLKSFPFVFWQHGERSFSHLGSHLRQFWDENAKRWSILSLTLATLPADFGWRTWPTKRMKPRLSGQDL